MSMRTSLSETKGKELGREEVRDVCFKTDMNPFWAPLTQRDTDS